MPKPTLAPYRRKRDFSRTDESVGGLIGTDGNRFVLHKHYASTDRYDLRLQRA